MRLFSNSMQEQRDVCSATLRTKPVLTDASNTLHVGACSSYEEAPLISLTTGAGNGCGDNPCWCHYLQSGYSCDWGQQVMHATILEMFDIAVAIFFFFLVTRKPRPVWLCGFRDWCS
ncbi:hypothetical protein Taro_006108 [Colocasia esculenta]|uniref:Uncharacterized protein n=1 Tax=Colocasia esculenta TaxID=4460 RepID=A0A843TWL7_COLES|nr:hypothetical protein [Colocasia esculenta]